MRNSSQTLRTTSPSKTIPLRTCKIEHNSCTPHIHYISRTHNAPSRTGRLSRHRRFRWPSPNNLRPIEVRNYTLVDNYHEPISLQETPLLPEWTIRLPHALSNWIGMYIHVTQCHAWPICIPSNIPCFGTFPFLLLINWTNLWHRSAHDVLPSFQNHRDLQNIHLLFINHYYPPLRSNPPYPTPHLL